MRTGSQRRANDRAQIVRIFHAVEQHDQALLAFRLIGVAMMSSSVAGARAATMATTP